MLQGNYIYSECKKEGGGGGLSLVPPGRCECKLSKRAERERESEQSRKKGNEVDKEFYATKEK